jgi:Flp pilus assembly protein TadD
MQTSVNTFRQAATIALMFSALAGALSPTAVHAQYGAGPAAAHVDDYASVTQLVGAKQFKEALNKADVYLASKPKDPQMRFIKGVILTEMGQTADAMSLFTTLTQDYPELPEPYNNLAVLHAAKNQFEQARTSLEMAIRTNPSYAAAHENLGDVYLQLASQSYTKALTLEPNKTSVQPKLALIRTLFSAKP